MDAMGKMHEPGDAEVRKAAAEADAGDSGLEDEYLTDAFDAAVGKDRKAFISAMRDAMRACMRSEESGEYGE